MPELPEVEALAAFLTRACGRPDDRHGVAGGAERAEDLRPAAVRAGRARDHGRAPVRQVPRHRRERPAPGDAPGAGRLAAVEGEAAHGAAASRQGAAGAAGDPRRRQRLRPHRGRAPRSGSRSTSCAIRSRFPASPGSASTRSIPSSPRRRSRACSRSASRSRASSPISRCSPGSATPTPTRCCGTRRMSPFKPAANLTPEEIQTLYDALVTTLRDAAERASGLAAGKPEGGEESRASRCTGVPGQACPRCGDTIREVAFATKSLQYCPTCQTGGKPLADRRLSRLLK